jgi:predicted deacylase
MTHTIETVELLSSSPGARRRLKVHRIGNRDARPKMYVQAGLHANETPGLLILHHLLDLALQADSRGEVLGELVLVPFANPIGLSENVLGNQIGREALDGGGNFNRGFPNLAGAAVSRLEGKLGQQPDANVALVRKTLQDILNEAKPKTELQHLQICLLKLSVDADYVFDFHTELAAVVGMIMGPWDEPYLHELIADINPDFHHHSDHPPLFQTVVTRPWHELAKCFALGEALPQACVGATLEMRGCTDVDDSLAREDASRLFRFLQRRGAVKGDPGPVPPLTSYESVHGGTEFVRAPVAGVVVYKRPLGSQVAAGDVVAEIVNPDADHPARARTPLRSQAAGIFYGARHTRLVRPNDVVAKIAGQTVLVDSGMY